jgi:biotin operon repressor
MRITISLAAFGLSLVLAGPSHANEIDWTKVDAALGKTPSVQGEVHRYSIPRSDLQVTLDGVTIKPALALGGWLGFEPMADGALVMGDLVLTETEINPVMAKLLESGIDVTAVHNHLLRANPPTFYMHVHGHGDPVTMATAIRAALAESKTPFGAPTAPAPQPAQIDLDTAALDGAIGTKGKVNGGVYQFSVPRKDPVTEDGMLIPPAMGTAIVINFQPTGGGKAAITGDFVVTADEVNPLISALRENGIEVTAIHSHMLDEQPRMFFVHFWANADAIKLAKGLQAALQRVAVAKG